MNFKQRLLDRKPLVGTFVKTPSAIICEVLAKTPLDTICLDAEHAPFDRIAIDRCIRALRAGGKSALVRVATSTPEHMLNALDVGADGIVVPHVTSVAMAEAIATAAHFGPGGRGYAGSTRAADYMGKSIAQHLTDSQQRTSVIAQIEDIEALSVIDDIAKVDAIDCLFVGRIDLTVALGAESPAAPEVVEAVETICAAGQAANRRVGMFVSSVDEVGFWRERGASLFLLSSDHSFLLQGAQQLVDSFQQH